MDVEFVRYARGFSAVGGRLGAIVNELARVQRKVPNRPQRIV